MASVLFRVILLHLLFLIYTWWSTDYCDALKLFKSKKINNTRRGMIMCQDRALVCEAPCKALKNVTQYLQCCKQCSRKAVKKEEEEEEDPCISLPCQHGGTCLPEGSEGQQMLDQGQERSGQARTGYVCLCKSKYTGKDCRESASYEKYRNKSCHILTCKKSFGRCFTASTQAALFHHFQDRRNKPPKERGVLQDDHKLKQLVKVLWDTNTFRKPKREGAREICVCIPGKQGLRCTLNCKAGTWGTYCINRCHDLCLPETCNPKTGSCTCEDGYELNMRTLQCVSVPTTIVNCKKFCRFGTCKHKHGRVCQCNYAEGAWCETRCSRIKPHPRYGKQCGAPCGACFEQPCSYETGKCRPSDDGRRCVDGFSGIKCDSFDGVVVAGQFFLSNIGSTDESRFLEDLERVKTDQKELGQLLNKVKLALYGSITAIAAATTVAVGGQVAVGVAFGVTLGTAIIGLGAVALAVVGLIKETKRSLLADEDEPGIEVKVELPLPPALINGTNPKKFMLKVLRKAAADLETDVIPGLGVATDSIQVNTVTRVSSVDTSGSNMTTLLPLVGLVTAAVLIMAAVLFALKVRLSRMERKQRKTTAGWKAWGPSNQMPRQQVKLSEQD